MTTSKLLSASYSKRASQGVGVFSSIWTLGKVEMCPMPVTLFSVARGCSRVARGGETFNSVPFCSILFHSLSSAWAGMRGSRFRRNDGFVRGNDACRQYSNRRSHGVMGSCRWFGGWAYVEGGMTLGPFANGPYIQTGPDMRGSRLHGNDACEQCSNQRGYGVRGSCRWFGGWAYVGDGMTLGPFANGPYIQTGGRDARFPRLQGTKEPSRERRSQGVPIAGRA